jgi:hypothetical protein
LTYGQINIFVLWALFMSYEMFRQRKYALGTFLWTLASWIKVFPALFGLWILKSKSKATLVYATVISAIIVFIPLVFWGPVISYELFFIEFPRQLSQKGVPTYSHNQSFLSLFFRLFRGDPFFLFSNGETNWTLLKLPQHSLQALSLLTGLTLSIAALYRANARRSHWDPLSAICFCIFFSSHIVWKPYFIFLFPPLLQLLSEMKPAAFPKKLPLWVFSFLILTVLSSPEVISPYYSSVADALNIHLLGAIVIFYAWFRQNNKMRPAASKDQDWPF